MTKFDVFGNKVEAVETAQERQERLNEEAYEKYIDSICHDDTIYGFGGSILRDGGEREEEDEFEGIEEDAAFLLKQGAITDDEYFSLLA